MRTRIAEITETGTIFGPAVPEDERHRRWMEMMPGVLATLPDDELEALEAWDALRPPGVGTAEWPGFAKYIGPPPWLVVPPAPIVQAYRKAEIPPKLRWEIWERDNFTCLRCGTRKLLVIDHVIPESRGGPTTADNLQTLCRSCNSKKGVGF